MSLHDLQSRRTAIFRRVRIALERNAAATARHQRNRSRRAQGTLTSFLKWTSKGPDMARLPILNWDGNAPKEASMKKPLARPGRPPGGDGLSPSSGINRPGPRHCFRERATRRRSRSISSTLTFTTSPAETTSLGSCTNLLASCEMPNCRAAASHRGFAGSRPPARMPWGRAWEPCGCIVIFAPYFGCCAKSRARGVGGSGLGDWSYIWEDGRKLHTSRKCYVEEKRKAES
jgi:hypothetical protein